MLKIQATIAGYGGSPITLVGVIDDEQGVLVIAKQVPYSEKAIVVTSGETEERFTLISNLDLKESDFKFNDEMIRDAIRSFYAMQAQGNLDIVDGISRYNPDNKIERESIDEKGPNYKIMPDIENGQMAVLAMVSFMEKQGEVNSLSDFYDGFLDPNYSITTI